MRRYRGWTTRRRRDPAPVVFRARDFRLRNTSNFRAKWEFGEMSIPAPQRLRSQSLNSHHRFANCEVIFTDVRVTVNRITMEIWKSHRHQLRF